jgi:hypothetical protein
MEQWTKIAEQVERGDFNLREYLTKSEGPQLFSTALNDKLLQGLAPELPQDYERIFDTVRINRKDITFPSIRGVNPQYIPEMGEFKYMDLQNFTSITVDPSKFGLRIGITREMVEDNEVNLIGYRTREVGRSHRELRRREHIKCISYYSTGPAVATGIIGIRNQGAFYPQGGYTNTLSATAWNWEGIIAEAFNRLKSQTITYGHEPIRVSFPVVPNFILAHPMYEMAVQKVLGVQTTVVGTGIGFQPAAAQGLNVAGGNIFAGQLPIRIFDPEMPTAQILIGQAGRGLVTVRRTDLEIETYENRPFDGDDLKSRERFLPAVIEERFIIDVQVSG